MTKSKVIVALLTVIELFTITGVEAANSGKQIAALGTVVTSAPCKNTYYAPGNLALQQAGKTQLPATRLDSFVAESGYNDAIYGDEGCVYEDFKLENRIETGINGERAAGLTTNHGSVLPSAWGKDEFISRAPSGWSMSGAATQEERTPLISEDPDLSIENNPWQDAN